MAPLQERAASFPRQGRLRLGSGRRGCLLCHATSSRRQGGQEHRDIWKRHSLDKRRGLHEARPPRGVRKRVGNNIRTAGTDREPQDSARGASRRSREDGHDGGGAAAGACSSGCQAPDAGKPHRRPFSARCGVPQCLRDASHYQAQVHSQDARSYQDSPGRKTHH